MQLTEPITQIKELLSLGISWKPYTTEEKELFEHSLCRLQKNIINLHAYGTHNQSDRLTRIDVGLPCNHVLLQMQKVYPSLKINYQISENHTILSVPHECELLIQNLLDNSCKFSLKGLVHLSVTWEENTLNILFKDDGLGFNIKDLSNYQKDFVQEDQSLTRSYEGLGLGLYLVEKCLHKLKGTYRFNQSYQGFSISISLQTRTKSTLKVSAEVWYAEG